MELKDYSTEELKAELKRRTEFAKAQKAKEMKTAAKCMNCKHLMNHPQGSITTKQGQLFPKWK